MCFVNLRLPLPTESNPEIKLDSPHSDVLPTRGELQLRELGGSMLPLQPSGGRYEPYHMMLLVSKRFLLSYGITVTQCLRHALPTPDLICKGYSILLALQYAGKCTKPSKKSSWPDVQPFKH